nr:hypothetical protein [Metabacillus flavus]
MRNNNGVEVECIEYGCAITRIVTPDRDGTLDNIVLGCRRLEDYINRVPYFGAVVGRVGGRIGKGHLPLNKNTYQVTANQEGNHLHGGKKDSVTGFGLQMQLNMSKMLQLHLLTSVRMVRKGFQGIWR